jgi:hypothetical protein
MGLSWLLIAFLLPKGSSSSMDNDNSFSPATEATTTLYTCLAHTRAEGETQAKGNRVTEDDEAKAHPPQPHAKPCNVWS